MNRVLVTMAAAAMFAGCASVQEKCQCDCAYCGCGGIPPVCTEAETAEGFTPLFDGETLKNWVPLKSGCYQVAKGGILEYRPDLGGGSLWTEKEYSDFCLRYDFKLTCDCNNGLAVRCPKSNLNTYTGGFEIQMIDDEGSMYKDVFPQLGLHHHPYQRHGAVYGVVPPKVRENGRSFLNPVGQWNHQEVTMVGSHLKVVLNGNVIQDVDLDKYPTDKSTMDHTPHPGIRSRKGCFAWLSHGYPCYWKNIRIKEL